LRHLSKQTVRSQSTAVTNLMAYIPGAVTTGYLSKPDTELPLPRPGFAHRINVLLTTMDPLRSHSASTRRSTCGAEHTSPRLDAANTVQRA
jgi:hypothetical protein